jgi:hypothetical protein
MVVNTKALMILVCCFLIVSCSAPRFMKGGLHKQLDEAITISSLTEKPEKFLDKEFVFSVRYFKTGKLPCPLGTGYVNLLIADRVSYITLDKAWMKEDRAGTLGSLKENETVLMRARVFQIDQQKDPNIEVLEIVPE